MSKFGPPPQPCSGCGKEFSAYDDKYHVVMYKDIVEKKSFKLKTKTTLHHLYFCKKCAEEFYDFMNTYSSNDGKAFWM